MYTLVRRFVKTALVFFVAGLALGGWILVEMAWGPSRALAPLISAHTHLLLFGFVIILIMGVAYWMFPRPAKEDLRYSPHMAEINYWLATVGTATRTIGDIMNYFSFLNGISMTLVFLGSFLQIAAGLLFAWNIWSRVRPIGSQHREARGDKF
ncbi:MAG: cbb3-type cytochrome c oxidase subunit I [Nitrospinota bacterium]|nr:cbb3-type cytochrome c oxidase subunit I [Nitrospinota bacterium]